MIGPALRSLLINDTTLSPLIGNRVNPVNLNQATTFPAIAYNTDELAPLPCREPGNTLRGTLEIGIMAKRYADVGPIVAALRALLYRRGHTALNYSLRFTSFIEGPAEEIQVGVDILTYLPVQIQFFATQLTTN